MCIHTDSHVFNAIWSFVIYKHPPEELLKAREEQVAQMGRYGRQNMLQWDDIPLDVFNRMYAAMARVIEQEGTLRKASEDS